MKFTVEQIFLTDNLSGRPADQVHSHLVEADNVDAALARFLESCSATVVGTIQKFPGAQAVATARTGNTHFVINLLPGSDVFRRRQPRAEKRIKNPEEDPRNRPSR